MLLLFDAFFTFDWLRAHHVTCKKLPTNNVLLMRNTVLSQRLTDQLFAQPFSFGKLSARQ